MQAPASSLLLRLQNEVLEAVAYGEPLEVIGEMLCHRAEELAPGVLCSILTVDSAGLLHPLAGPSLPAAYSSLLDGVPIGPVAGSCGTAAYRGEPVVVSDIETDPLWVDYKDLALGVGLRACWSSPIKDRNGRVIGTFAFYRRVVAGASAVEQQIVTTCVHLCAIAMEHRAVQERNHRLAFFDVLTGLPNRARFNQLLEMRIAQGKPFGLLFVDIDHLKAVNDTMGHGFGDLFIKTVGERIRSADWRITPCRIGGDEFAILVDQCASHETLAQVAANIIGRASSMIESEAQTVSSSITAGGAIFGQDGADAETLYQNADFALYHAKEVRRGGFVPFSSDLRSSMLDNLNLVRSVDLALVERRMLAHYQPIVRMDTGEIVGLEALARLRTPTGRIMSAGAFQPALADPRIAYRLTDVMLRTVAQDIRHWLDLGIPLQHVGVNVTTGDFQRGDLNSRIAEAFAAAGVPLKHVILEVNEAVYMGGADKEFARSIEALRQQGVLVALDDFGTGFASLTHLLSFPVDIIKIDKSFVDRLVTDTSSAVIAGGIIDIAKKLGMKIVAEGVETGEQAEKLLALGCPLGQGYLYSRPCGVAEVTELLAKFAQGVQSRPRAQAATQAPAPRLRRLSK